MMKRIETLLSKYRKKQLSEEEFEELRQLTLSGEYESEIKNDITLQLYSAANTHSLSTDQQDEIIRKIIETK